jgi:hypothetical protein
MIEDFDTWKEVNKVVNKNKSFEEQLEECWDTAQANLLRENKDLEKRLEDAEEDLRDNTCPYDHCYYSDAEDLDSDLSDANQKLEKCSEIRKEFNDILERMQDCDNFSEFKDDITKDFEVLCAKFDNIDLF